jgi:hypothetical protein
MQAAPRISEAIVRVKSLFLELPGSKLTAVETAKLSGVDLEVCRHILEALADGRFLRRSRDETFAYRNIDSVDS